MAILLLISTVARKNIVDGSNKRCDEVRENQGAEKGCSTAESTLSSCILPKLPHCRGIVANYCVNTSKLVPGDNESAVYDSDPGGLVCGREFAYQPDQREIRENG